MQQGPKPIKTDYFTTFLDTVNKGRIEDEKAKAAVTTASLTGAVGEEIRLILPEVGNALPGLRLWRMMYDPVMLERLSDTTISGKTLMAHFGASPVLGESPAAREVRFKCLQPGQTNILVEFMVNDPKPADKGIFRLTIKSSASAPN